MKTVRSSTKLVARALATAALTAGVLAIALVPAARGAFSLPAYEPGRTVYDFAGIWSGATTARVEAALDALAAEAAPRIVVVSAPTGLSSISTEMARSDAAAIMDAWGIGQAKVNDGLVILFDMDASLVHGQIYLFTGSGFRDRYLGDAAARSVTDQMLNRAREGDFDGALEVGVDEIAAAVRSPGSRAGILGSLTVGTIIAGLVILADLGLVLFALWRWWTRGRDPEIPLIDDSVLLPAPPPGMTPSLAALLRDAGDANGSAPGAAMLDLASRGYLHLTEATPEHEGGKTALDIELTEGGGEQAAGTRGRTTPLGEPEQVLLDGIRGAAQGGVLSHQALRRGAGRPIFEAFSRSLGRTGGASPWFTGDPVAASSKLAGLAVLTFLGIFPVFFSDQSDSLEPVALLAVVTSFVATGAIFFVARAMGARTERGSYELAMALAYRNTLRHEIGEAPGLTDALTRSRVRMPWLETPDALVVWAVALGLAKEIGDCLERSLTAAAAGTTGSAAYTPAWYSGSGGSFSSFGSAIGGITTTATSSSSSGGGGSSSGGGGAGGGF